MMLFKKSSKDATAPEVEQKEVAPKDTENKTILDNDKFVKLLAVLIAIVSWFVIATFIDPDTPKDIKNVPISVSISGTSAEHNNLEIVDISLEDVDVRVEGKSYKVGLLTENDFDVTLNMSGVTKPGTYSLEVQAKKVDTQDTDFDILYTNVNYVDVTFDRLMSATFDLKYKTSNIEIEPGLFMEQAVITPNKIDITGPSAVVSTIAYCVVENDEAKTIKTSTVLDGVLKCYDAERNEIDSKSLKYDDTEFKITIPLYKRQNVPVAFDYINVPEGFDVSKLNYVISKSELEVGVPVDVENDLESVVLGTIDFRDIDIGSVFSFDVSLLAGYINIDGVNEITVEFPEDGISSTVMSSENIVFKNKPAHYNFELVTERLNDIKIVGATSVIETLSSNDIVVCVDLGDVSVAEGEKRLAVEIYMSGHEQAWAVGSEYSILVDITKKTVE